MQKLSRRRPTDTPGGIPHAPGSVALRRSDAGDRSAHRPALNSPEGRDSEMGLSTRDNNSDAALTPF